MVWPLLADADVVDGLLNLRNVLDVSDSQCVTGLQVDLAALWHFAASAVRSVHAARAMVALGRMRLQKIRSK